MLLVFSVKTLIFIVKIYKLKWIREYDIMERVLKEGTQNEMVS